MTEKFSVADRSGGRWRGQTAKGHEGTFPGGRHVLYLGCGGGDYKTMYIYQNS